MIIRVSGVSHMGGDTPHYKTAYYQPKNLNDLKKDISKDFDKKLAGSLKKYNIDIMI
jgi:hypothetical protein